MPDRRSFLRSTALGAAAGLPLLGACAAGEDPATDQDPTGGGASSAPGEAIRPVALSTWNHGLAANREAWPILESGGRALDAVEAGVRVSEADPAVTSVGYGGAPDRDGHVTLDACIMDEAGRCGSVAFLREILHPISVARRVMEETPHVMLVGQGAQDFAVAQGFERQNMLTPEADERWRRWLDENGETGPPPINAENHDTIGMLALDRNGDLSGACTTSGAAYKLHGRVGDSPIIGAGLYVDNAVGGATATGWGEAVIRAVGCFLVVELMRQGHDPQEACRLAVERVIEKNPDWADIQVGFIALDKRGRTGGYCIAPGFDYAVKTPDRDELVVAASRLG